MRKNQWGFTILEGLLVVILVTGIVIGVWHIFGIEKASDATVSTLSSGQENPMGIVTVTYADKGKTVVLHKGQSLNVDLSSTYWAIHDAANTRVVALSGQPTATETQPCVTGGGCGHALAHFVTVATGTTTISASRSACGEAMACSGGQGTFTITVVVKP